jgi:hypothetical protein
MEKENLVLLVKAESHIERGALINELEEKGLHPVSAERDISRKTTSTTLDLSFEGYSAFFDGFSIYIPINEKAQADLIVNEMRTRVQKDKTPANPNYLLKFYFMAMFGLAFPGISQIPGFYFLYKGLRANEKIKPVIFMTSLLLNVISLLVGYLILESYIKQLL